MAVLNGGYGGTSSGSGASGLLVMRFCISLYAVHGAI